MSIPKKPPGRDDLTNFAAIFFASYCAVGLFGTWRIVDEFDALRILLVAWMGVPAWFIWHVLDFWRPHLAGERNKLSNTLAALCLVVFGWANLLLLNAVGSSLTERSYRNVGGQIMNVTEYRGGFGHLYRYR